jgi:hypothetical protein
MLPLLPSDSRFPLPDWNQVHASRPVGLDAASPGDFWMIQGREWVHLLKSSLGTGYVGYESRNFLLVSSASAETCHRLIGWAEGIKAKIHEMLRLDFDKASLGNTLIIVVHDLETYYEYFAAYVPDGSYAGSGGVYLNRGYGHFVFCYLDMSQAESVLAHELTHACVAHLPLPAWLNEGVAQLCEITLTKRDHTRYEEIKESLATHWNSLTIQELWDGSGFLKDDDSQMHCYHLAKVLTARLSRQQRGFHDFLHEAQADDAGEAAVRKHWNLSLADLVADYLGEGDWQPRLPLKRPLDIESA